MATSSNAATALNKKGSSRSGKKNRTVPPIDKIKDKATTFLNDQGVFEDNINESFKAAIGDHIIHHEMLLTKKRIEKKLQDEGAIFYMTEKTKLDEEEQYRKFRVSVFVTLAFAGLAFYIAGKFAGYDQANNQFKKMVEAGEITVNK